MQWDERVRGRIAMRGVLVLALAVLMGPMLWWLLPPIYTSFAENVGWMAVFATLGLVLLPGRLAERRPVRVVRLVGAVLAMAGLAAAPLHNSAWLVWTLDEGLRLAEALPQIDPQLLLALLPALVAGVGSVAFTLCPSPADARRLRMHLLPVVLSFGLGLYLVLELMVAGTPFLPLMAKLVTGGLAFGALVVALWPALPGHTGAAWSTVTGSEREWTLELRSMGPRDVRRILLVLGTGVLTAVVAVGGQALPLPDTLEKVWFVTLFGGGLAAVVEAAAMLGPRLVAGGRVRVRPAHVVVEREGLLRRSRRMVSAVDVVLRVRQDWQGTLLDVGDGVVVAVDLSPTELEAALAPVRPRILKEHPVEEARARTSLRGLAASVDHRSGPLAAVREPLRVWHARLALLGHLLVVLLLAIAAVRAPAWSWVDGLLAVSLVATGLSMGRLVVGRFKAFRRRRSAAVSSAAPGAVPVLDAAPQGAQEPPPRASKPPLPRIACVAGSSMQST